MIDRLYDSVALLAPAHRIVAVVAYDFGERGLADRIFPVIALQAAVADRQEIERELLIVTDDLGVCDYRQLETSNTACRAVVCTWPPEEDEERLRDVVEGLHAEVAAKTGRREGPAPTLRCQ
jgi:hypothetical protein